MSVNEMANDIYSIFHSDPMSIAIAQLLYKKGWRRYEWISVDDRLPEKNGKYLVVCKGLKSPVVRPFVTTFMSLQEVTHWMPLPEMPRKGANNEQR